MAQIPKPVVEFLSGRRFAVAGVSRDRGQPANAVFRKLCASGYEVFPVNPHAAEVEGARCYPDLGSLPGPIDGVVIAAHADVAAALVRQCADYGIGRLWFHRSFGEGSVSAAALRECDAHGIVPIVGGCPLMYCAPVDLGHRCMRWWLRWQRRVPG